MAELFAVDWPSIRAQAVESFGEAPPHPEVEDDVIRVFEQNPRMVLKAISDISADVATGKVRSGWRVLRSHVQKVQEARSSASVVISDDRDTRVKRARRWMWTEGGAIESPQEMEEALFGIPVLSGTAAELRELRVQQQAKYPDFRPGVNNVMGWAARLLEAQIARAEENGPEVLSPAGTEPLLAPWKADLALRGEFADLWLKARQAAELGEREQDERARDYRAQRERIAARAAQVARQLNEAVDAREEVHA